MKIITDDLLKNLPPLGVPFHKGLDALAVVKFISENSEWVWYATSGSLIDEDHRANTDKEKVDFHFNGLVIRVEPVPYLLSFSIYELEGRGLFEHHAKQDHTYTPKTLRQLIKEYKEEFKEDYESDDYFEEWKDLGE